jgi:hypothetical protein
MALRPVAQPPRTRGFRVPSYGDGTDLLTRFVVELNDFEAIKSRRPQPAPFDLPRTEFPWVSPGEENHERTGRSRLSMKSDTELG